MGRALLLCALACTLAAVSSTNAPETAAGSSHSWDPIVSVREVTVLNLLSGFGSAIAGACTGAATKSAFNPFGCPNLSVIEMGDVSVGSSEQSADMLATVVATSGLPAAVMSYFSVASNFNLTGVHCVHGDNKCAQQLVSKLLDRDFGDVVDVSASEFVAAMAFQSIIEFEDVNGDGKYTPQQDLVVSSYDFLLPGGSSQPLWGPTKLSTVQLASGATRYLLNTTTQDGVFSMQLAVADTVQQLPAAGIEVSVQIRNFPYASTSGTTKLCLLTYVGTRDAQASFQISSNRLSFQHGGYMSALTWKPTAKATFSSGSSAGIPVSSSSWMGTTAVMEESLSASLAKLALTTNGVFTGTSSTRATYFSFDVQSPTYLYWDPQLVFEKSVETSFSVVAEVVVIVACVTVAAFAVMLWRRSRVKPASSPVARRLLDPTHASYSQQQPTIQSDFAKPAAAEDFCGNCGAGLAASDSSGFCATCAGF